VKDATFLLCFVWIRLESPSCVRAWALFAFDCVNDGLRRFGCGYGFEMTTLECYLRRSWDWVCAGRWLFWWKEKGWCCDVLELVLRCVTGFGFRCCCVLLQVFVLIFGPQDCVCRFWFIVMDFDSRVCLKDVENLHFGLEWKLCLSTNVLSLGNRWEAWIGLEWPVWGAWCVLGWGPPFLDIIWTK